MTIPVEDSPNSAGVGINAIRAAKTALDRKMSGVIDSACPYLFKNPPIAADEESTFSKFYAYAKVS